MFAAVCDSLNVTEAAGNMPVQQVSELTPEQLRQEQQQVERIVSQMIGRDLDAETVSDDLAPIVKRLTEAVRDFRKAEIFSDPFTAPAVPRGLASPQVSVATQTSVPAMKSTHTTTAVDAPSLAATEAMALSPTEKDFEQSQVADTHSTDNLPVVSTNLEVDTSKPQWYTKRSVGEAVSAVEAEVATQRQTVNNVAKPVRIKCRNERLACKRHPETNVLYTERMVSIDGQQYIVVAPEFDSMFDAQLPDELWCARDKKQFKECTHQLWSAVQTDPNLKAIFSESQLREIKNGKTPKGYTWHHDVEAGKMQLVLTEVHSKAGHTGGRSLWGGGKKFR